MRKILLLFLTILFSNVALCQTENELNNMIVESTSKFIDSCKESYKYPRKEYERKGDKRTVVDLYYCVEGLPSCFSDEYVTIKGVKPINVNFFKCNAKQVVKDMRRGIDVVFIKYELNSNQILIITRLVQARLHGNRQIDLGSTEDSLRFLYQYSCESNTWELVESK